MNLHLSPAPHVHSSQSTRVLMLHVLIALLPCAAVGIGYFGYSALALMLASVLSAVLAEYLWQTLTRQKVRVGDLSAAVTGLILALNLPPHAPLWLAVFRLSKLCVRAWRRTAFNGLQALSTAPAILF